MGKNLPQFSVGTLAKCILIRGTVIERNILLQSLPEMTETSFYHRLKCAGRVNIDIELSYYMKRQKRKISLISIGQESEVNIVSPDPLQRGYE